MREPFPSSHSFFFLKKGGWEVNFERTLSHLTVGRLFGWVRVHFVRVWEVLPGSAVPVWRLTSHLLGPLPFTTFVGAHSVDSSPWSLHPPPAPRLTLPDQPLLFCLLLIFHFSPVLLSGHCIYLSYLLPCECVTPALRSSLRALSLSSQDPACLMAISLLTRHTSPHSPYLLRAGLCC